MFPVELLCKPSNTLECVHIEPNTTDKGQKESGEDVMTGEEARRKRRNKKGNKKGRIRIERKNTCIGLDKSG